jgi:opacity protein-like surface antigen
MRTGTVARTTVVAAGWLLLVAADASPQATVPADDSASASTLRVTAERATIWSRNPSLVIAVVKQDTLLGAVAREAQWFEVLVPAAAGGTGNTGFVYAGHVELVADTPMPPERQARPPQPASAGRGRPPVQRPAFGVRGFGAFSYMFFQASDSFEAIFGEASHPLYGGGGEVVLADRVFVRGEAERFRRTGERVIVFGDEVFRLGIPNTVTITPVTVSAGYRFRSSGSLVPYAGGGAGAYGFREESRFADQDDLVSERFTSYHALAGFEYAVSRWAFTAFEVRYTTVPDSLGAPGVSGEFGENNLGGLSVRVRVMVGR